MTVSATAVSLAVGMASATAFVVVVVAMSALAMMATVSATVAVAAIFALARHGVDKACDFFGCGVVAFYDFTTEMKIHAGKLVIEVDDDGVFLYFFYESVEVHAVGVFHRNDVAGVDCLGIKVSATVAEDALGQFFYSGFVVGAESLVLGNGEVKLVAGFEVFDIFFKVGQRETEPGDEVETVVAIGLFDKDRLFTLFCYEEFVIYAEVFVFCHKGLVFVKYCEFLQKYNKKPRTEEKQRKNCVIDTNRLQMLWFLFGRLVESVDCMQHRIAPDRHIPGLGVSLRIDTAIDV